MSEFKFNKKLRLKGDIKLGASMRSRINESRITSRFDRAVEQSINGLAAALDKGLQSALRNSSYQMPSNDNNIYDSGALASSQNISINGNRITINYDVPYANLIYYGGYINPYGNKYTKVYIPPRPWIQDYLQGMIGEPINFTEIYSNFLKEVF